MGDEDPFDMSMGVDAHESHSYETELDIGQSQLQQPGPPGPPCGILSRLVFQPVLEEPSTNWQDESEGEESNDVVIFEPDIEPGTPVADHEYQIENLLLHTVEEARKLDQMRRIDDLG